MITNWLVIDYTDRAAGNQILSNLLKQILLSIIREHIFYKQKNRQICYVVLTSHDNQTLHTTNYADFALNTGLA